VLTQALPTMYHALELDKYTIKPELAVLIVILTRRLKTIIHSAELILADQINKSLISTATVNGAKEQRLLILNREIALKEDSSN
jgi:hypothetical protein